MIQKDMAYNPFKIGMPKSISELDSVNRELVENMVWGSGKASAIREYYKTLKISQPYDNKHTYFATTCPSSFRYIHSGLPKLISEGMSKLIFGNGYSFAVNYADEEGNINEVKSAELTDLLNDIIKNTNLKETMLESAVTESICGDVGWKASFDFSLSLYPIIEKLDRRYYCVHQIRGIPQEIEFYNFYEKKEGGSVRYYKQIERYTHNDLKECVIENELVRLDAGREIPMPLNYIDETALLEPLQVINNFKGQMCWHKKNLTYTGLITSYPYGDSDYTNAIDTFDGCDEVVTQIVAEIRDKKPIRFLDEEMFEKDENGNFMRINSYITNYLKKPHNADQNVKEMDIQEFTDTTQLHLMKYKTMIEMACCGCKISPITLGLSGNIGIANSDETIREKTEISRETAQTKKQRWTDYLNKTLKDILEFTHYLTTREDYPIGVKALKLKKAFEGVDWNAIEVDTTINSFDEKSEEDLLATWASAYNSGIVSLDRVVDKILVNATEDEKKTEINRLRIEKGLALDNPELLRLDDEEDEDGEEE